MHIIPDSGRRMMLRAGAAWAGALAAGGAASEEQPAIDVLQMQGSRIEVQFADGFDSGLRLRARQWVRQSAMAVAGYFGRFPLPQVELLVLPAEGSGVRGGTTFGVPEPYVRLRVGTETTEGQFHDDWVLVHEMVHLAVPRVPRRQSWLQEGLATYVEGIARTRAGLLSAPVLWQTMAHDMPQGQPKDGDAGLDNTPTWGRTYWGGAIFCLLADVQIRRRSGGRLGLEHALRGVLAAGGSYAVAWPLVKTLEVAGASIGQSTLGELYALMKDCPDPVDLVSLWQDLGIRSGNAFDDAAPLAVVRRAIAG